MSLPSLGGIVTDQNEFLKNSTKYNPYGLFSEQIFGPVNDLKCQCGKLIGPINEGKICVKCNVLCGSSELRYNQFGLINTIFPYINPNKMTTLKKMLGKLSNVLFNPDRNDLNLDSKKYIAVKLDKSALKLVDEFNAITDYLVIPFRITGLYSLYIVIKFLSKYLKVEVATDILTNGYIKNELKVIPPNLRMFSYDSSKNKKRTPLINKFYTTVINLNRSNLPLYEIIKDDEQELLQKIKICLKDKIFDQDIIETNMYIYDSNSSAYQKAINNIYETVYNTLSGKEGLIRNMVLGRTIDFSARAAIATDPSLMPYQIKVSKKILKVLWAPYFMHYLINYKDMDCTHCFEKYMLQEMHNLDESDKLFDEFLEWFYAD
jgi:DNA-directed RNA polymerase beta' subunit